MKIMIAGGTGFIGQHLVQHFLPQGIEIGIISRKKKSVTQIYGNQVQAITWDEFSAKGRELLQECSFVINLTGANIGAKRWSNSRKNEIITSRLDSTTLISQYCADLYDKSPALFNASAIGVYGLQKDLSHSFPPAMDEFTEINFDSYPDFSAEVTRKWEKATEVAKAHGVRVVNMRFGVVLAKSGGALEKIVMPFRFGLGGPIGSGKQAFSWVHIKDLIRAIDFLIAHGDIRGQVNIVSPGCVSQKELAKALGAAMKKPSFMPTPGFMLKLIFGQMADELLLNGQHVYPRKLLNAGFKFTFPDIASALSDIFY